MFVRTKDGVNLHVQQMGSGPPVVMLHGLVTANMATWYFSVAPELAKDYRVIIYDLRGHGRSDRALSGYSVDAMSRDLGCILDGLVDQPAHLIGHSFGGCVALNFATKYPERVRSLSVIEAPLPPVNEWALQQLSGDFRGWTADAARKSPMDVKRNVINSTARSKRFLDSLKFFVHESTLLNDMRAEQDIPLHVLEALCVPTLALYGSQSDCRAAGRRIAASVPIVKHVELDGGHHLPSEDPQGVTRNLLAFLNLHASSPVPAAESHETAEVHSI